MYNDACFFPKKNEYGVINANNNYKFTKVKYNSDKRNCTLKNTVFQITDYFS